MKISVITATYNCVNTIDDCLASVQGQSHPDVEHIVVDGASTDGTIAVVESRHDCRGSLVSEPDNGIYDALNKGIARARGDVVGFLHADDLYADTGVLARIAAAFADPAVEAVYGDLVYVRKEDTGKVVRYWRSRPFFRRQLAWGWMPPHPTFYVRRELYQRFGAFDTTYRIAADYDCMLRVCNKITKAIIGIGG